MPNVTVSVIDWLTLALVVATIYYAWQTHQTVEELRRTRGVAVLPRLVASIYPKAAGIGWIRIANVGPGPALDVAATLTFEPGGGTVGWRSHVVASGEVHELGPSPDGPDGESEYRIEELTKRFTHLRFAATYRDALGDSQSINEAVEIRDWWRAVKAANEHTPHDWSEETAKELEKIGEGIGNLAEEAYRARRARQPEVPLAQRVDATMRALAANAPEGAAEPAPAEVADDQAPV